MVDVRSPRVTTDPARNEQEVATVEVSLDHGSSRIQSGDYSINHPSKGCAAQFLEQPIKANTHVVGSSEHVTRLLPQVVESAVDAAG
jgi:hypothetical protein